MELQRHDLALAGRPAPERLAHGGATQRDLGPVLDPAARILGLARPRVGQPPAAAQLVESRVARDAEQPGSLLAAAAIKGPPAPVGPLEGQRGHVLGRRRIAQQRGHIGVDVVTAGAIERLEALPRAGRVEAPGRVCEYDHTLTTKERRDFITASIW